MQRTIWLLLILVLAATGCVGSQGAQSENPDVITRAEIQAVGATDAYSLVQQLRPLWLQKRGPHSFVNERGIIVYLDSMPHEGVGTLRYVDASEIHTLRYIGPGRATALYGTGHVHGAILVEMRGG